MIRKSIISVFLVIFTICAGASNYPKLYLQKGDMKVLLLLPDSVNSYYTASRFEWGSMLAQITYKNCNFLQNWENYCGRGPSGEHNPLTPNTGTGLAEEFTNPLGYADAKINDTFIKIGVGELLKESMDEYDFAKPYKILCTGKREIKSDKNSIKIKHTLNSKTGYGYILEKAYEIKRNKLIVKHKLFNIGEKRILTETYSHNFLQFNYQNYSDDFYIMFTNSNIDISNEKWVTKNRMIFGKNKIDINYEIKDFTPSFGGVNVLSQNKTFKLANEKTGMAVKVSFSSPINSFFIWSWQKAFCPEAKVLIDLMPGKSYEWNYVYEFFPEVKKVDWNK